MRPTTQILSRSYALCARTSSFTSNSWMTIEMHKGPRVAVVWRNGLLQRYCGPRDRMQAKGFRVTAQNKVREVKAPVEPPQPTPVPHRHKRTTKKHRLRHTYG